MKLLAALLFVLVILPSLPASEIGFYQWVGLDPDPSTSLLRSARDRAAQTGVTTLRLYLGPRFDYDQPYLSPNRFARRTEKPVTPASILALPHLQATLDDPRFSTLILTVYSALDYGAGPDDINLLRPFGDRERKAVHSQISELTRLFYTRYGDQDRTVILANNEVDEKLMEIANYSQSPQLAVANLISWINARQDAVEEVRREFPQARLRVLHAFEISVVNLKIALIDGRYRKTARTIQGWSALRDVVPHVRFDLLSYSAYESANSPFRTRNTDTPPEQTGLRLSRDLDRIARASQASVSPFGKRLFGAKSVMIGELGFAREKFESAPSGGVLPRLQSAIETAAEWGCPWVILWQVFDAPRWGSRSWGFGAFDAAGDRPSLAPAANGCASVADCVESWTDNNGARPGRSAAK